MSCLKKLQESLNFCVLASVDCLHIFIIPSIFFRIYFVLDISYLDPPLNPYSGSSLTVMDGFCVIVRFYINFTSYKLHIPQINSISMRNCSTFSHQIIMTRSSSGANKCDLAANENNLNALKTLYIFVCFVWCWDWNNSPPTLPPIPKKNRFSK